MLFPGGVVWMHSERWRSSRVKCPLYINLIHSCGKSCRDLYLCPFFFFNLFTSQFKQDGTGCLLIKDSCLVSATSCKCQELLVPAALCQDLCWQGESQNPALPPLLLLVETFLVCDLPMSPCNSILLLSSLKKYPQSNFYSDSRA